MKIKIISFIVLLLIFSGCAELLNVLQTTGTTALTEGDVISGLKEALVTGAKNSAGKLANLKPVDTNLDDFLTNKALTGMFLKVEGEELKIRKEVSARVTPLLQKVFGTLDNKTN
jgi:hypothetical protein